MSLRELEANEALSRELVARNCVSADCMFVTGGNLFFHHSGCGRHPQAVVRQMFGKDGLGCSSFRNQDGPGTLKPDGTIER